MTSLLRKAATRHCSGRDEWDTLDGNFPVILFFVALIVLRVQISWPKRTKRRKTRFISSKNSAIFLLLEADESADFSVAPKDKTAAHLNSIHRNDLKFRWKNVLVAYFDRVKSQIFICSRWTFTNFFSLWWRKRFRFFRFRHTQHLRNFFSPVRCQCTSTQTARRHTCVATPGANVNTIISIPQTFGPLTSFFQHFRSTKKWKTRYHHNSLQFYRIKWITPVCYVYSRVYLSVSFIRFFFRTKRGMEINFEKIGISSIF